jgi:hypothetical protein
MGLKTKNRRAGSTRGGYDKHEAEGETRPYISPSGGALSGKEYVIFAFMVRASSLEEDIANLSGEVGRVKKFDWHDRIQ